MKISVDITRSFSEPNANSLGIEQLVEKIGAQLGAVDEVIDLKAKYANTIIVKVVSCEDHPNADKLHICKIDDGGVVKDVERDENGHVQVVCGAPNVREGIFVVWIPPGATVPATYVMAEPFVLGKRELRGVVSNGMLASPQELGIGDSHEGLLLIDLGEWKPNDVAIVPGVAFAKAYGLDDTIIDVENKMFTHRPDLFGQLGVAREIAGIQQQPFTDPDWYWELPNFVSPQNADLDVYNQAPDKVSRFMAVVIDNVAVKPSPLWLQCELVKMGGKPINNIVDATNYIMLITAQPTHAYDYNALRDAKLGVRMATAGEKLPLLNGKTYELTNEDIVIVDGQGPIGLGGIMGGGNSEVTPATKKIVLEVATFDMYTVRKTSMRYGLFTDAVTRFSKGQSPLQNDRVLAKLIEVLGYTNKEQQIGGVVDIHNLGTTYEAQSLSGELRIQPGFINERLGLDLPGDKIATLLRNVHFAVHEDTSGDLVITAPFWRTDIEINEDIVEEVGRLYGFDHLPLVLPIRTTEPTPIDALLSLKQTVRHILRRAGANEVLGYSFVHGDLLKKVQQNSTQAFRLSNALSPNLQYYRLSLTPSLLEKVHPNKKAGFDTFGLFELGKVHHVNTITEEGIPKSINRLAYVYASNDKQLHARRGAAYYAAATALDCLLNELKVSYTLQPTTDAEAPFEPSRSAHIIAGDGSVLGVIGEYVLPAITALKLPKYCAGFELSTDNLLEHVIDTSSYVPLPKFPKVSQDMSLKVSGEVVFADVYNQLVVALDSAKPTESWATLAPLDIYQADTGAKHMSFRLQIASYDRTMTAEEVNALLDTIAGSVKTQFGAERI